MKNKAKGEGKMIFADGYCPKCDSLCGNGGGDRLVCKCGWQSEKLNLSFPASVKTEYGEWLRAQRREKRISLYTLSQTTGILPSRISGFEHRGETPTEAERDDIRRGLDVIAFATERKG